MRKHLGSTIAIILGVPLTITGVTNSNSFAIAGPIIVLGALAYRSAKKRKLGEVNDSLLRKGVEIITIIAIVCAVLLQNNLGYLIETDPFPNLIIPLLVLIAYLVINLKKPIITK